MRKVVASAWITLDGIFDAGENPTPSGDRGPEARSSRRRWREPNLRSNPAATTSRRPYPRALCFSKATRPAWSRSSSTSLTNAAKYMDPGGNIWLTVEHRESQWLVRIRDNGKGLASEILPHVFDLFAQAEAGSQGGLGIGLNLVKGLVEMHGGSVEALSAGPGQGSEFVVRLPTRPLGPPASSPAF
jgi:hypothetical protein